MFFSEARELLDQGRKVRRAVWKEGVYAYDYQYDKSIDKYTLEVSEPSLVYGVQQPMPTTIFVNALSRRATDWEEYIDVPYVPDGNGNPDNPPF